MTPKTKLRGPLLWMVLIATLLAATSIAGMAFTFGGLRHLIPPYRIAISYLTVWAVVFVVMTLFRMPSTPVVTSVGLTIWVVGRLAIVALISPWPGAIDLLAELFMVVSFCGYMATGELPNAYYRRRLPAA